MSWRLGQIGKLQKWKSAKKKNQQKTKKVALLSPSRRRRFFLYFSLFLTNTCIPWQKKLVSRHFKCSYEIRSMHLSFCRPRCLQKKKKKKVDGNFVLWNRVNGEPGSTRRRWCWLQKTEFVHWMTAHIGLIVCFLRCLSTVPSFTNIVLLLLNCSKKKKINKKNYCWWNP